MKKVIWEETYRLDAFDGDSLVDMITHLQMYADRYPGAMIEDIATRWSDHYHLAIMIPREETDIEYEKRLMKEKSQQDKIIENELKTLKILQEKYKDKLDAIHS